MSPVSFRVYGIPLPQTFRILSAGSFPPPVPIQSVPFCVLTVRRTALLPLCMKSANKIIRIYYEPGIPFKLWLYLFFEPPHQDIVHVYVCKYGWANEIIFFCCIMPRIILGRRTEMGLGCNTD